MHSLGYGRLGNSHCILVFKIESEILLSPSIQERSVALLSQLEPYSRPWLPSPDLSP